MHSIDHISERAKTIMDIINLLPDSVANQIAAGEVIQRPASVVKELMENAIDAGAVKIQLIIKEAGRKLIQVIDDGKGMSEVDARMSFERHATSKINKAEDLFYLHTKGFRGEALASIAAISHVELKTCQEQMNLGTRIIIEGSKVIEQEPCAQSTGSSFSVKNLFYNVPARRKFLKSDNTELRTIIEEFQRVALAHPEIAFTFVKDDNVELFNLRAGALRQRVLGIMGNSFDQRLVPVQETTDVVGVEGFVGKPEFAKRSKGEQYLFLNKRFIKNGYLHHAISRAYDELLPEKNQPSYFLFLSVPTERVDINIHPTKTEVKFEDEKVIYAILMSAVRRSLGRYNIAPSIDFNEENSFKVPAMTKGQAIHIPQINVDPSYNPFVKKEQTSQRAINFPSRSQSQGDSWKELYQVSRQMQTEEFHPTAPDEKSQMTFPSMDTHGRERLFYQLNERYMVSSIKSALIVIDIQRAEERVLYETFIRSLALNEGRSQQLLFPETKDLSAADMALITEHLQAFKSIGFDIEPFGARTIKVNGVPAIAGEFDVFKLLEEWMEDFKTEVPNAKNKHETLARTLAQRMRNPGEKRLKGEEMRELIDRLFACEQPYHSPSGKAVIVNIGMDELDRKFKRTI
jgi:DNA mismatch repair protein MutL